jgi:tripeptide aminopeptidase
MTQTVERFKMLVPIANPSGKEAAIRDYIQQQLQYMGFLDNIVDQAGNLFARIPGNAEKKTLLLSAHMDSVPPCEGIEPLEDNLEGRKIIRSAGSTILGADDKSGIAVILSLLHRLKSEGSQNHHPLELLFSTQEEVGLLGVQAFDLKQSQADSAFVLDGEGSVGDIFYSGPSQKNLLFQVEGLRSHAGIAPEAGVSAIEMAIHLCASLPSGRLSPETTMNLGTIQGGDALNIVAPSATIRGEARSHDDKALNSLLQRIQDICHEVQEQFPKGKIEFIATHRYTRFELPQTHPAVLMVAAACEPCGIPPQLRKMNIGSDAHVLNHAGLPTVVLGMGFHHSHSLGEYIYQDELEQVTQLVWQMIQHE